MQMGNPFYVRGLNFLFYISFKEIDFLILMFQKGSRDVRRRFVYNCTMDASFSIINIFAQMSLAVGNRIRKSISW